jgi:hypothetical protein
MSRLGRGFPVQVRNVAAVRAAASGPQTWTGTDGTVLVTATSDAFSASGTVSWSGTGATVQIDATSSAFSRGASLQISGRKLVDSNGNVYLLHTMASWGITNLTTNANIDTALDGVAAAGFNGITFWVGGTWDASGWNMYTDGQGRAWWTGTVWGSTFGTAWNGVDYIVAGCASRGLTATLSFNASNTGPDWEARTNAQMQTVGSTVATRYLSSPNIVWHVMFDDAPGATHTTASTRGQRAKAIFQGINGVEGTNTRVRWMEPARTDSNYATGWVTDTDIHVMNCWYDYGGNSTEIVEAGYTESGATTYPVGDCEPPYDGSPHYTGSRPQQLRERTYASFIEGGTYAQFGHEDWWPFGASGIYTESLTWSQVPTDAHVLEQGYAFGVINTYCANAAWEPDSTFVGSTVAGSGETKAASGSCGTSAVAYFPSSRTITVDTTVITGTGNVRLRWFDPVLNTYSSIAASEAQNATRSISYPSNHADGTSDFVLIVDNPDQTWTGTGATVTITATSGSFTPGGTATWTGNGATVTVTATSDSFAASGTAVWSSTDGLVTVTGTSSSFVGTGTTVWTGTDATVTRDVDAFTVGAATWTGRPSRSLQRRTPSSPARSPGPATAAPSPLLAPPGCSPPARSPGQGPTGWSRSRRPPGRSGSAPDRRHGTARRAPSPSPRHRTRSPPPAPSCGPATAARSPCRRRRARSRPVLSPGPATPARLPSRRRPGRSPWQAPRHGSGPPPPSSSPLRAGRSAVAHSSRSSAPGRSA